MAATTPDYTAQLRVHMERVGLPSFQALSTAARVSRTQIRHLRQGQLQKMTVETLVKLSECLQISWFELVNEFMAASPKIAAQHEVCAPSVSTPESLQALRQEYDRLQGQLTTQADQLEQEFQRQTIQTLESLLLQWPTAAYAAQQNPQAPAVRLLPLLRPLDQLLQAWGIEAIAPVGSEVEYDPKLHQLMDGQAAIGDRVRVRYTGYRQGLTLLYRAKVSPVSGSD